jgi:hypothetical protein
MAEIVAVARSLNEGVLIANVFHRDFYTDPFKFPTVVIACSFPHVGIARKFMLREVVIRNHLGSALPEVGTDVESKKTAPARD